MLNLIGPAENFQQFVSAAMVRFKAVFYFHVSGFAKFFILTSFLILDYYNTKEVPLKAVPTETRKCCPYTVAAEQKARVTYDNILRLSDDPDVNDVIKFLRAREVVHFQRFGEGLRLAKDRMDEKNVYFINPSFDR